MARIGVIDSGFGGLSFVQAYAEKGSKNHTIIYAGDNARAPYGVRSIGELYQFATELIDYLKQVHCVDMVIIACGTLATNVLSQLQAHYSLPIYGISQQLFEVDCVWSEPVGVIATERTVSSQYFQECFAKRKIQSVVRSTQSFVDMVEGRKIVDTGVIKEELLDVAHCKMLILGCTHFPFLKEEIQELLPQIELVDPAISLISIVDALQSEKRRSFCYITSGDKVQFKQFIEKHNLPEGEVQYENFARIK